MPTFSYPPGFKWLIPDSYSCSDGCNSHYFKIIKSQYSYTTIHDGHTETFCLNRIPNDNPKLCLENWMLSNSLWYDTYPDSTNLCINGYRNTTYVEKIQKTIDKNFSAEQTKTLEHTRIALDEGICFCNDLFKSLKNQGGFDEDALLSFSAYLNGYRFPHLKEILYKVPKRSKEWQRINNIKKVFDYIKAHPNVMNNAITTDIIKEFYKSYKK